MIICILIVKQLQSDDTDQIIDYFKQNNGTNDHKLLLFTILILMPLNWYLEGKKWQLLMSPFVKIGWLQSIKIVLAGIATGIFTPGRIGEYAGRAITSDKDQKQEVITATLLGSIAQNFWNIAGGLVLSYYFIKNTFHVTNWLVISLILIVAVQIVILLLMYYRMPKVADWLTTKTWLHRYKDRLVDMEVYSKPLLNQVLLLSFVRYGIYTGQYILTMFFFGVDVPFMTMLGNITGIFLIQTGIPLPTLMSIIARGEIAILVWSTSGVRSIIALAATFLIWFINLILPAIAGLIILSKTDFYQYFKKDRHE